MPYRLLISFFLFFPSFSWGQDTPSVLLQTNLAEAENLSAKEKSQLSDVFYEALRAKVDQLETQIFYRQADQYDTFNSLLVYSEKMVEWNPENLQKQLLNGQIWRYSGDFLNAETSYLNALELLKKQPPKPEYAQIYLEISVLKSVISGNAEDALEILAEGMEYLKGFEESKPYQLLESRRLDLLTRSPERRLETEATLRETIKNQPDALNLQLMQARFYENVDTQKARLLYQKLTEKENAPYIAYFSFAKFLATQAQKHETAISRTSNSDEIRALQADAKRTYTEAVTILEQALPKADQPKIVLEALIGNCKKAGLAEKAAKYGKRLKEL